jgi:hypothetical protein
MARSLDNPDRNFSANGDADEDLEALRQALHSDPALPYNEAAKVRIGKIIADAVLPSRVRSPMRRLDVKRPGLP